MILYLDFDGVLHPDEAYWYGPERGVLLKTANLPLEYADHDLFCYAPALTEILDDFPEVRIVLSTSWVGSDRMGYDISRDSLPLGLRERVIDATRQALATRYEQVLEHVCAGRITNWIALDNDAEGWPVTSRDRLVHTDDYRGIGDPDARAELREKLESMRRL